MFNFYKFLQCSKKFIRKIKNNLLNNDLNELLHVHLFQVEIDLKNQYLFYFLKYFQSNCNANFKLK